MHGSQRSRKPADHDCVARARRVAEVLAAGAARIEADCTIPADILDAMHEARLFRLLLPYSLGGDELDPVTLAQVTEVIAAADASAAWCIGQASGCAMTAASLEPAVAQRVFGPRDAVLAWGAGAAGKAVAIDGGYRVTGTWTFASGIRNATWVGAHCRVFERDGEPRLRADGRQLERTALFPRAETKIHDVWQVMGLCGTGSDSYEFSDQFVPDELMVDREDLSDLHGAGPVFQFPGTHVYAAAFGGVMLGIARGALDDLLALATTKTQRGAATSMRESPAFQTQLAQLVARHRAARHHHLGTLREVWSELEVGAELTLEHRTSIRLAATHTIQQGVQIVIDAYRAAGQTAIFDAHPFERRLRDALTASQQVQGRTTHYMTIGRHLLGLPPDTMMFL
jgi:alkylation response protein AidB-like acyl-CoA dehydrogenase